MITEGEAKHEIHDMNFIYTLGQIKNEVSNVGDQMRSSFNRLESKLDNSVKDFDTRLKIVESYHSKLKTQIAVIVTLISSATVIIGPVIRDWIF